MAPCTKLNARPTNPLVLSSDTTLPSMKLGDKTMMVLEIDEYSRPGHTQPQNKKKQGGNLEPNSLEIQWCSKCILHSSSFNFSGYTKNNKACNIPLKSPIKWLPTNKKKFKIFNFCQVFRAIFEKVPILNFFLDGDFWVKLSANLPHWVLWNTNTK